MILPLHFASQNISLSLILLEKNQFGWDDAQKFEWPVKRRTRFKKFVVPEPLVRFQIFKRDFPDLNELHILTFGNKNRTKSYVKKNKYKKKCEYSKDIRTYKINTLPDFFR